FGGLLGSAGLVLRRRWSIPLLAVSLAAVAVQMLALYLLTPAWQASGAPGLAFSLLIVAIAAFLLAYARRASARGWLRCPRGRRCRAATSRRKAPAAWRTRRAGPAPRRRPGGQGGRCRSRHRRPGAPTSCLRARSAPGTARR